MASPTFTVAQISDFHLDPLDSRSIERFSNVQQQVERMKPDLVVATGDVSDDGYCRDGVLEQVKAELDRWKVPMQIIPGNHDVGDKAGEANQITPQYLAQWKQVFGADRFSVTRANWMLIGINTQIIGSGLREEGYQIGWLDEKLNQAARDGRYVAVFLHAAPYLFDPTEVLPDGSQYWGFDPHPRRELVQRLHRPHVRLVANGHLHWHYLVERGAAKWVWCPAPDLIVDDAIFPRGGGVIGFVLHTFSKDNAEPRLVELDLPARTIHVFRPTVKLPGREPVIIAELVLDFSGTLSKDGELLPQIGDQLTELSKRVRITVLTADTFNTASKTLRGLPVTVQIVCTGPDKRALVEKLGPQHVVVIGNGRNDAPMMRTAAIGIAVIGPEGCAAELLGVADVVTHSIDDALDLIANPLRLKATLRD